MTTALGLALLFLVLHLLAARIARPFMPEQMTTHFGPAGTNGTMTRTWGLRIGWIVSLGLSAIMLSPALFGGRMPAPTRALLPQVVVLIGMLFIYGVNARIGRTKKEGGR